MNGIRVLVVLIGVVMATFGYADNIKDKDSKQASSYEHGVKLRGNSIVIDNSFCNTNMQNSLSDRLKAPKDIYMIKDDKGCETQSH